MNKKQISTIESILSNSCRNIRNNFDKYIKNVEIADIIGIHADYFVDKHPDLCRKILKELFNNNQDSFTYRYNLKTVLDNIINNETGFDVLKPLSLLEDICIKFKTELELRKHEFIDQLILENKRSVNYDSFIHQINIWSDNLNENIVKFSKIVDEYYNILNVDLEKALVYFVDNREFFKIEVPKIQKEKTDV